MAWTAPMTAVANTAFTAAQFNTYVRDNLLETAPAKATAAGGYFVGNGSNSLVERFWSEDLNTASASTSSTSYADLPGSMGPSVTVATSQRAIVIISGRMRNNTNAEYALMGVAISGDTTMAAHDSRCLAFEQPGGVSGQDSQASYVWPVGNLTPGSNTFTCKYRASAGTATFDNRRITVLPY